MILGRHVRSFGSCVGGGRCLCILGACLLVPGVLLSLGRFVLPHAAAHAHGCACTLRGHATGFHSRDLQVLTLLHHSQPPAACPIALAPPTGRILNVTVCPADTNEPPRLLNYLTAPQVSRDVISRPSGAPIAYLDHCHAEDPPTCSSARCRHVPNFEHAHKPHRRVLMETLEKTLLTWLATTHMNTRAGAHLVRSRRLLLLPRPLPPTAHCGAQQQGGSGEVSDALRACLDLPAYVSAASCFSASASLLVPNTVIKCLL